MSENLTAELSLSSDGVEELSARTRANRQNALKSTGPRTPAGKNASRRNAIKHGLCSEVIVPEVVAEENEARVRLWTESIAPRNLLESDLVELAATTMTRVKLCWREETAARTRASKRAGMVWDRDRQAEVAALADKLSSQPERISFELSRTCQGLNWLLKTWKELQVRLDQPQGWTAPQVDRALDLLGVPEVFRDDLHPLAFKTLDSAAQTEARRRVVAEEVERLSTLAERFKEIDELERTDRADGLNTQTDPEVARLARYESALARRMTALLGLIRTTRKDDETKPTPQTREVAGPLVSPKIEEDYDDELSEDELDCEASDLAVVREGTSQTRRDPAQTNQPAFPKTRSRRGEFTRAGLLGL